jgi:hypothetical protein
MQKSLSNFKRALWRITSGALFAVVCTGSLWAQDRVVTGKVTSTEDNAGIPGVNIILKGTTLGTVTDADGKYSINAGSDAILVISSIGYLTIEVTVGSQTSIDVALVTDIKTLATMPGDTQRIDTLHIIYVPYVTMWLNILTDKEF